MKQRPLFLLSVLVGLLAMAITITGCGGSDSTTGAGTETATGGTTSTGGGSSRVEEARQLVAEDEKPTTAPPELPPVADVSSLRGKSVAYISAGLSFPFSQQVLTGSEDAANALGMTIQATDTKGDPAAASSQIEQAIDRNASAIILQGTDPASVAAAVSAAKSAEVPVISVAALPESKVDPSLAAEGISASVVFSAAETGERLANFVAADSEGTAEVGVIGSSTFQISQPMIEAFTAQLTKLCPGCKIAEADSPLPQWTTTLQSSTASLLTSHPEMNYVFPLVDAMAPQVKAAIAASAGTRGVKFVSQNASLPDLEAIAGGNDPEVANVGGPNERLGWGAFDQIARLLTGEEAVSNEEIPLRTFTAGNIGEIDLSASPGTFFGSFDFAAYYEKLWGK